MSAQTTVDREVATRVFAQEFNDASFSFTESDDEQAPVYLLLPTGAKANRVFITGTLTEKEDVGDDSEYWRGRVSDSTGTFFVYAGQYQPEAAAKLQDTETPTRIAVVGKPRTYERDDGSVSVSIRPEQITEIDQQARQKWTNLTAKRTAERLEKHASFLDTADDLAEGEAIAAYKYSKMAVDEYDSSLETYQRIVLEALEATGEIDEVGTISRESQDETSSSSDSDPSESGENSSPSDSGMGAAHEPFPDS